MGAWKTCCSLVADLALFGPTVRVLFLVEEVLAPHWDSVAGAWSPSLDGDLDTRDRRVMG